MTYSKGLLRIRGDGVSPKYLAIQALHVPIKLVSIKILFVTWNLEQAQHEEIYFFFLKTTHLKISQDKKLKIEIT